MIHATPTTPVLTVKQPAPLSSGSGIAISLGLALATFAVYFPVRNHPYFGPDDLLYIVQNSHIHAGLTWSTVVWAFKNYYINWIPLTWLSHSLDYQLFGINPMGHHLVNVLFHSLNAIILFWVLQKATGYTWRSVMVAALFALHPINVESVAWVAERKTLLSTTFFLFALGAYRWYVCKPQEKRYWVVAGLFVLALLAKPQVIAFPLLLLLWDYWPLRRMHLGFEGIDEQPSATSCFEKHSLGWLIREKIPFFALAAADALMTLQAQGVSRPASQPFPIGIRVGNAIVSYVRYIGKALWPEWLSPYYSHPGSSLSKLLVLLCLAVIISITLLVLKLHRRGYLIVGWLWFLISMVPMIGIVQVGRQAMADRYAYQPYIGLFLMICWAVGDLYQQKHLPATLPIAASVVVLAALAIVARLQVDYWQNDLSLWKHAVAVTKDNALAEYSVGNALVATGDRSAAMPYFYRAWALDPNDPWTNLQIGWYDCDQKQFTEAIPYFNIAVSAGIQRYQGDATLSAYRSLAAAYRNLGDLAKAQDYQSRADRLKQIMPVP